MAIVAKLVLVFYTMLFPDCSMTVCLHPDAGEWPGVACANSWHDGDYAYWLRTQHEQWVKNERTERWLWNGRLDGTTESFRLPYLHAYDCGHFE